MCFGFDRRVSQSDQRFSHLVAHAWLVVPRGRHQVPKLLPGLVGSIAVGSGGADAVVCGDTSIAVVVVLLLSN